MELKANYHNTIQKELLEELKLQNVMQVPTLSKITLNIGLGEALNNPQALERMSSDLAMIAGQKPVVTKARKAISNFKIRQGFSIGLAVTLRGQKMWDFYYKLVTIVLPRVKDFRGVNPHSFDKQGNYSLGIREHTIFPEIDPAAVDKTRSFEVTIVTTGRNPEHARLLLKKLGMPFRSLEK